MDERNAQGQFTQGSKGGPGRPSKARELAYLAVIAEEVTLDDWRQVVAKALDDARNGEDGRTRELGRRFIADYVIGKPKQTIHLGTRDSFNEFADYSDDDLRTIVAAADADSDGSAGDTGEPGGSTH